MNISIRTWKQYAELAKRTAPLERPASERLKNAILGLIGESGEVADIVKKFMFQSGTGYPLPVDRLVDECGDVLWYTAEFADCLGLSLDQVFEVVKPPHVFAEVFVDDVLRNGSDSDNRLLRNTLYAQVFDLCSNISDIHAIALPTQLATLSNEIRHLSMGSVYSLQKAMIALCNILMVCGKSMAEARNYNIEKLMRRYPEGFDPERSLNRTV